MKNVWPVPVRNLSSSNSRTHHVLVYCIKETTLPYVINYRWFIKKRKSSVQLIWADSFPWKGQKPVRNIKQAIFVQSYSKIIQVMMWQHNSSRSYHYLPCSKSIILYCPKAFCSFKRYLMQCLLKFIPFVNCGLFLYALISTGTSEFIYLQSQTYKAQIWNLNVFK